MENAISIINVSKTFRIYNKPLNRLKQFFSKEKKYYQDFTALNELSFEINKGETVGIIGRNGSGKSTLLQMIAGTLNPSTGSIKVNGRISALLELGSGFNPEFTGRENVYLNAAILGIGREEIESKMDEILAFADIGDFIDQPVKTYSSGMYVRLAFAVSINVNPEILIVDEALAVGDGRFQLKCFEKIKALKESGKTILVVSHDLQTIRQICDRAILIDRGQLIEIGKPNDVVNHYTKILFSKMPANNDQIAAAIENDPVETQESTASNDENAVSSSEFKGANSVDIEATKEYRYGSSEGTIEHIYVNDVANSEADSHTVTSLDNLKVRFVARAFKIIEKPIYAMTIKSIKGLDVYGTNTYFQNYPFKMLSNNDEVAVEFQQELRLIPGDYYISLGFVELVNGEIIPLDRRYDVIELKVLANENDRSFGISNLDSKISLNYGEDH
ncbi:ABC transporter ATP-binding protein [Paenibacillus sp. NPDC058174]|uniref:ABC transporter ATP-binding protein n=1 Tax=Paenibacillus sp. NPDC058174 TaxID=3346366 RepID=UPI0036D83644